MQKRRRVEDPNGLLCVMIDGCLFLCSRFLTQFSHTSCLHTSAALNTKNWERKNRMLYPPQEKDEPRRPA
ncbi:39S ribosomal protein L22, mitochondrial, partial [Tachysurus ichikawai]